MKYIAIILLFCSCSFLRKSHKSDVHINTSQTEQAKDSLQVFTKDSVYTKHEQSENVNTVEIEFDTLGVWDDNDTMQNIGTITGRFPINGDDYFSIPVKQKIKKIKITTANTESKKDSTGVKTQNLSQIKEKNATQKANVAASSSESKTKCGIPLWNIIVLAAVAFFIWYAIRWYKSLRIPPL